MGTKLFWSRTYALKGQLISKCLFGVLNSYKKTNKNNSTWGTIVVRSNFLVHSLEELKIPKRYFKINCPLAKGWKMYLQSTVHLRFYHSTPLSTEDAKYKRDLRNQIIHHLNCHNRCFDLILEKNQLGPFRCCCVQWMSMLEFWDFEILTLILTSKLSHHLGMSYYVNFLGGLGSNEFQLKWRFGTHGN